MQRWEEWKATAGTTDMKFKFLWIEAEMGGRPTEWTLEDGRDISLRSNPGRVHILSYEKRHMSFRNLDHKLGEELKKVREKVEQRVSVQS